MSIRLKALLRERHWQKYATFCREYDKAARAIDPDLVGTAPSRAQLHRWLSGELKALPYPDHCRILEQMLPGWTARQLFAAIDDGPTANDFGVDELLRTVTSALQVPDADRSQWGAPSTGRLSNVAPISDYQSDDAPEPTRRIARKLVTLSRVLRLDAAETARLASLSGNIVELDTKVDVAISIDGWSRITYMHELFNMSDRPLTRIPRELWFEHTGKPIEISPITVGSRRVNIQRLHDTTSLAKFACQLSPAINPGETATFGYSCAGGQFISDHYWRQSIARYTRHLTISVRHEGAGSVVQCTATEEHPDGSENSAAEQLIWDNEGRDAIITLARDYLRPNQSVTVRWEVDHAVA